MTITHVKTVSELNGLLANKDKITIIDFHATWCGPCHMIAPAFEALSKQYKDVNFLKCDVDDAKEIAAMYSVSAMPTFIFLKGSEKVDMVRGANKSGLETALRKHAPGSSTAFSGKGQRLGDDEGGKSPWDTISDMDPQLKILVGLFGAYFLFWYLSRQ